MKKDKKTISLMLCLFLILTSIQPVSAVTQTSAEKLNQLGLLLNISDQELAAELSREVGLTMILKALGYTQDDADDYVSESPFADTERWSKGWAALAYSLKITTGTSTTTFSPTQPLNEREFLTFLLRALGHDPSDAYVETEDLSKEYGLLGMSESISSSGYTKQEASIAMYNSLSSTYLPENIPLANLLMEKGLFDLSEATAVGLKDGNLEILRIKVITPHEFKVIFNQPVETNKMTFMLKNAISSYGAIASWDGTKTIATIVAADDMRNGTYSLVANYLSTSVSTYSLDFDVVSPIEKSVEITSEYVVLENDAKVIIEVKDGFDLPTYDETVSVTARNLSAQVDLTVTKVRDGYYSLSDLLSSSGRLGDSVEISVEYDDVVSVKTLAVVDQSDLESFILINPLVNNGRLQGNQSNITIDYRGLTENGSSYWLPFHTSNMDGRNDFETIGDVTFYSSNPGVLDVDFMKVDLFGNLKANITNLGTTVLTAQNNNTGQLTAVTITVYDDAEISMVDLKTNSKIIAIGEKNELSAQAFDQFGAKMDFNYISGLQYVSSDETVVPLSNIKLLNNTFSYTGVKEGTSFITVYSKESRLLLSIAVSIQAEPEAIGIIGIDVPKYFEATTDAEYRITYNDIQVIDQFDRPYDLDIKDEVINISHEDETDDIMNFGSNQIFGGGLTIKATNTVGKGSYTFKVENIAYAVMTKDFETIHADDIKTYDLPEVNDLEIGLINQKTISLRGLTSEGNDIVLGSNHIDFVTMTDTSIAETVVDGNEITIKGLEGGTATISVWKNGKVIAETSITVLAAEGD